MKTRHLPTRPGVYLLRCTHNGLTYVGSSLDVRRRVQNHMKRLERHTHVCKMLLSAFLAAGPKRFEAVLLCECVPEDLNRLEEAEWRRLKQAGLLLAGSEHFITQSDREEHYGKSEAMRARWADPEKRAALAERINATRATQEYRDDCKGRNSEAIKTRWSGVGEERRGLSQLPRTGKWMARANVGGKRVSLGVFATEQEAREAYLEAMKKGK